MRRFNRLPSPSLAISLLALFVALGGTAYAATGGTFILGQANTASSQTSLTAGVAGTTTGPRSVLSLRNTSTASGAEGLAITVGANKAPIHVNSTAGKATFLNVDKLDGLDSTQLSPAAAVGGTNDVALNPFSLAPVLSTSLRTARASTLVASAALEIEDRDGVVGGSAEEPFCFLRFDGAVESVRYATSLGNTFSADPASLALVWGHQVGAGTHTVELLCASNSGAVMVDNAGLTVTSHL